MPEQNSKPVVLLIYADTGQPLAHLKEETDAIASHLSSSGLCDVEIVPAATLTNVVTTINDPALRDRVVIVHYAGHADGQGIQLSSDQGHTQSELAHMRGLAGVLKTQPHLRLLFINGCASREQVLELTQAGIPLIIATNQGIDDKVARDFADHFYTTLKQERSIGAAFQVAADTIQTGTGTNIRGLYFGDFQNSKPARYNDLPWEIHGPDADRHWTLCDPYYRGSGPRWDHTKYELNQESPYIGLRYFAENESDRFFGRDEFVKDLVAASETTPLLLIIGASGTGKSSVIRAGMIPAWKKSNRDAGSPRVFVFTPEDDPFDQLSIELAKVDTFDRHQVREVRQPSPTALRDACNSFQQGEPWLFFVDQFEQVFTRTNDKQKRADFLNSITGLAKANDSNVCLVLAMRDDFFPQLRDYPELFPITDNHFFRVATLDRKALEEVIQRPAAEHGVTFQPGLVDDIIDAIKGQPGALPLLQYALNALWEHDDLADRMLNQSTYNDLGGVTGSLGRRFEQLYNQQDDAGKNEFRWMMLKLVTYGDAVAETSVVSRLAPKSEFVGRQAELLEQLTTQEKLLVSSGTSTPSVQLGHEKIIEAWPEYTEWTHEHQEANSIRQQLSRAASEWTGLKGEGKKAARALWQGSQLVKALELRKRGDFDQLGGLDPDDNRFLGTSYRRSQKMIRGLQWAIGVAFMLGAFGWWQFSDANSQKREALISQSKALGAASRLSTSEGNATLGMLLALEALPKQVGKGRKFVASAEASLLYAMFAQREKYLLSDHTDGVNNVRFSPQGTLVATASRDGTVRFWNATTGETTVTLQGHDGQVYSAEFSPDGRRSVTASSDKTARLWSVETGKKIGPPLQGHQGDVYRASFSPDGKLVVTASDDGTARVWRLSDSGLEGEPVVLSDHTGPVYWAEFSPKGDRVVTASDDGTARVWRLSDAALEGDPVVLSSHTKPVFHASFSPDGTRIVTASWDHTARLWDVLTGKSIALEGHQDGVSRAVFSPDGKLVVTTSADSTARLWDGMTGRPVAVLKGHNGQVYDARFSRDGGWLVTAADDGTIRLWDVAARETIDIFVGHVGRVWSAVFSPDGKHVATASEDNTARIWEVAPNNIMAELKGHKGHVHRAIFAPDGRRLVTVSDDGTVRIWDAKTGDEIAVLTEHEGEVWYAAFAEHGHLFVTTSTDGTARLWDTATGRLVHTLSGHEGLVNHAHFSSDGQQIVTGGKEGTARVWDVASGKTVAILGGHQGPVNFVEFSHDDRHIATASQDNTARLWNASTGELIASLTEHRGPVINGAFSPDDRWLVTVSWDGTARLWDGTSGKALSILRGHTDAVSSATFSPDSQLVVTASSDNTARIWDAASGKPLLALRGHGGEIFDASFSSDGRLILTASGDGTARLWHVASGIHVATLEGHGGFVVNAAFAPDGRHVATASWDHTARLWRLPVATSVDWITYARESVPRELTDDERRLYLGD